MRIKYTNEEWLKESRTISVFSDYFMN